MIELTENAITHLKNLTEKNKKNYVRLSVKGGGCAGFEYEWTFEDEEGYTREDILLEDLLLILLSEGFLIQMGAFSLIKERVIKEFTQE